jgi:hypothetical protein
MKLNITIDGPIDSLMLWELIKDIKPNLTDMGEKIYVYKDDLSMTEATFIISRCQLFGDCEIHLSRPKAP